MSPPSKPTGVPEVWWAEDALDDQFLIRQSIVEPEAVRLRFLNDGKQLVEALRQRLPDLVVVDINMPVLGGLLALRQLRADERTRELPAVVFSTAREERDLQEASRLRVLDFVQKPSRFEEFQRAVQGILALARRLPRGGGSEAVLGLAERGTPWSRPSMAHPARRLE